MPSLGETLTHFTRAFSEKDGFEHHAGLSKDAKFLYEKRRILTTINSFFLSFFK
jgi:hypothetical protein